MTEVGAVQQVPKEIRWVIWDEDGNQVGSVTLPAGELDVIVKLVEYYSEQKGHRPPSAHSIKVGS